MLMNDDNDFQVTIRVLSVAQSAEMSSTLLFVFDKTSCCEPFKLLILTYKYHAFLH